MRVDFCVFYLWAGWGCIVVERANQFAAMLIAAMLGSDAPAQCEKMIR